MQAVVLAGGLGERLRPLTLRLPKPMAEVRGRPFLEHQLEFVRRQGIRRVLLLVSYLGDVIERHFGDGGVHGLEITYSYEPSPLGTAGALGLALPRLDGSFLLLNGDTYLDIDLAAFAARFRDCRREALMAVYVNRSPRIAPDNVRVTPGGLVDRYQKGEQAGMTHVDAGVYAMRRSVVERLEVGRPASLEHNVFPPLAARGELAAFETAVRYFDIGTFDRLGAAEKGLP